MKKTDSQLVTGERGGKGGERESEREFSPAMSPISFYAIKVSQP